MKDNDIFRYVPPAHGGSDPGAVFNGRQEKDDNLKLALAVGRILEEHGMDVVYSRTEDFYDSPYEKAMQGNESEADLFLSIHRNAALIPGSGTGVDLLVYADTGFSSDVAEQIGEAIARTGFQYNGITERPNLAVLRRTKMPAVLVEAGFIDNEDDNLFFDENFEELAEAIAQGILQTIDRDKKELETTESPTNQTKIMGSPTKQPKTIGSPTDHPENYLMNTNRIDHNKLPESEQHPVSPDRKPGLWEEKRLYRVQAGAFTNPMFATQLLNQLLLEGFPAFVIFSDGLYRVQVGAFSILENAIRMEKKLRAQGYQTYITL